MYWCFGCEACGTLASYQGSNYNTTMEGELLTTEPWKSSIVRSSLGIGNLNRQECPGTRGKALERELDCLLRPEEASWLSSQLEITTLIATGKAGSAWKTDLQTELRKSIL